MARSNDQQSATYQHFVPQFLLRNFAHPYVDEEATESSLKGKSRRKKPKRRDGKPFPGELVVHSAKLSCDPIELVETPVKRILGQMDMYRDTNQPPPKQQHIEEMFSQMESRVSTIFRKITKAFSAGDPGLWLTRPERNDVRKFLFLMKYRGSGYHRRFCYHTPEEYNSDDQELFREYMAEKGFARPIDVWFHNLKTIMELDMDPARDWMDKVRRSMYRADADMFIMHTEYFYMTICTPNDPSDEFIVTDGCYNVFEGRTAYARDVQSEEVDMVQFVNFHEFTPISPKLMIVLRSFLFPLAEEDSIPRIKKGRDTCRRMAVDNVYGPEVFRHSLLFDLPVKKARNSYSTLVHGTPTLAEGEDGVFKRSDRFCFNFFPIERSHVQKINGIFLDNALNCTNVVFASRDSFFRSLEWYMTAPPELIGKHVKVDQGDKRLQLLQKLDILMRSMGSKKLSMWQDAPIDDVYHRELHDFWTIYLIREKHKMEDDPASPRNETLLAHALLGGSTTEFWGDLAQASRMWTLRVKIDSWSQGVDERIRQHNRDLLTKSYLRCPPWRVWLYLKHMKWAHLADEDRAYTGHDVEPESLKDVVGGIEDTIARARLLLDQDQPMNHLLYATVANEIEMRKRPGLSLWQNLAFTWMDMPRIALIVTIAFQNSGPICLCGIPKIQVLALAIENELREVKNIEVRGFDTSPFLEDEILEILIRIKVREAFLNIFDGQMPREALEELKKVFFEFTYPTPPTLEE